MNITGKPDVWQGTLALMVLRALQTLGPLHGYGIARRIEQTSGNLLTGITARFTLRCSSSNRRAISPLNGGSPTTIAGLNITSSQAVAEKNLTKKLAIGNRPQPFLRVS